MPIPRIKQPVIIYRADVSAVRYVSMKNPTIGKINDTINKLRYGTFVIINPFTMLAGTAPAINDSSI
ncbi:hypothetical protein D3C84_1046810 [compost metagenome]